MKGKGPKDDPMLFDPTLEPTHKLRRYDVEELGALDLKSLFEVRFPTVVSEE